MEKYQEFLIALGGNLPSEVGVPDQTLRAALDRLGRSEMRIEAVSGLYNTPCFPPGAGPDYVNAAARIAYTGTPSELLNLLHDVEAQFGRERTQRWGRRTLDIDLIAAGDTVVPDLETFALWRDLSADQQVQQIPGTLILPHPRLQDRAFVLVPLADVAPNWVHPVLGQTVQQMLQNLPDKDKTEVHAL